MRGRCVRGLVCCVPLDVSRLAWPRRRSISVPVSTSAASLHVSVCGEKLCVEACKQQAPVVHRYTSIHSLLYVPVHFRDGRFVCCVPLGISSRLASLSLPFLSASSSHVHLDARRVFSMSLTVCEGCVFQPCNLRLHCGACMFTLQRALLAAVGSVHCCTCLSCSGSGAWLHLAVSHSPTDFSWRSSDTHSLVSCRR